MGKKYLEAKASKKSYKREVLIAKKDFTICHNDYFKKIKEGDDISEVPKMFHENLKTEKVL